jgi:hypothetical protein
LTKNILNNYKIDIEMKKLLFSMAFVFVGVASFAQTTFEKIMAEKIQLLNKTESVSDYKKLFEEFVNIGANEQKEAMPYYYAALAAMKTGKAEQKQGITKDLDYYAGLGEKFATLSESMSPSAENHILLGMSYSLRVSLNPKERFGTYGRKVAEELAKAEKMDPKNPRISLLKAENTYTLPENLGGSKEKGLQIFKQAVEQFKTYKAKSPISPTWGQIDAEYYLNKK